MVTIIDYAMRENSQGENFFALIVQSGLQVVKSKETGKSYFTAKKASVPSTFNEVTCKSLVGTELPGSIKKIECDPYEFRIEESGEKVTLSHRYEYTQEADTLEGVVTEEKVITAETVHA
jgi:hypothetical protein